MKLNYWLIIGAMLSTSLLAQPTTNTPPAAPATSVPATPAPTLTPAPAETNAPAKATKKKSAKKKSGKSSEKQAAKKTEKQAAVKKPAAKKAAPAAELKTIPLVPGPAMVVASNVNVRGQAKLKSEVVTRVTKGAPVTVIEEIVDNKSGPEEPSAWAKIVLPPGAHAWVNTMFIDTNNFTVRPKKLNVRSGAGENYSVIGVLQKGDAVKELKTKGEWIEIEPPANAYGFIAAQYLSQEAAQVAAAPTTPVTPAVPPAPTPPEPKPATPVTPPPQPEPTPAPTTVASAPTVAPPPAEAPTVPTPIVTPPVVTPPKPPPVETAVMNPPMVPPAVEPEVPEGPVPPRIVQREGIVRGMTSIVAPSKFVLISPENKKDIDYLYTTSTELDLRRYKGLRVIVIGEEGLDDRWGNTPVLTIQSIKPVRGDE
jgi:uncharacterized protein YgiM (DUF1202 family)